jgi:hypothetical protein
MSFHVSLYYSDQLLIKSGEREGGVRGVKYVFLGLRRQLCCQAKGKNRHEIERLQNLVWSPCFFFFPWLNMDLSSAVDANDPVALFFGRLAAAAAAAAAAQRLCR